MIGTIGMGMKKQAFRFQDLANVLVKVGEIEI